MRDAEYPVLADLMSGWFHQDFDVNGGTVAEVVLAFRKVTPVASQSKLKSELARFLIDHPDDLDEAFELRFRPDVIPAALSGSTRAFLTDVGNLLS